MEQDTNLASLREKSRIWSVLRPRKSLQLSQATGQGRYRLRGGIKLQTCQTPLPKKKKLQIEGLGPVIL